MERGKVVVGDGERGRVVMQLVRIHQSRLHQGKWKNRMQTLHRVIVKDIGRRTNLFVPFSLTHETSWATSSITTFLRSALTFQVRKRVAVILREHLPDDFLPPPPIPTSLPLSESDQGNLVGNLSS